MRKNYVLPYTILCAVFLFNTLYLNKRNIINNTMIILRRLTPIVKRNSLRVLYSTSIEDKVEEIKVDKYTVKYTKIGNGPNRVLCMPGAIGNVWKDFKPQIEGFDREKFSLIVWDPPYYGINRPNEKAAPFVIHERDMQYAYKFMQALNLPIFSLMGWSYGAILSIRLAGTYPEAVQKMVLWGARATIHNKELQAYKDGFCGKNIHTFSTLLNIPELRDLSTWSEANRKSMIAIYPEEELAKYWSDFIDIVEETYNCDGGNVCSEYLKFVTCPTFILHGGKDPLIDYSNVPYLQRNIEDSRVHLYPEGKHNFHIKYAEDFNQRVQEFLLEGK